MKITTYEKALEVLDSFIKPVVFAKIRPEDAKLNDPLDRMRKLLELLDNPQYKFKSVLVGGTSGKGSTSYLISHLLISAGYKTGYTLSPHLQRITERIQINEQEISKKDFVHLVNKILPVVSKMKSMQIGEPSHFEVLIAMAFLYFAEKKVDIAVVEVGLGGRFDATNTLFPLISVVTNVSLDHTAILGDTVELIAKEKVEIIKKTQNHNSKFKSNSSAPIVITGVRQPSVIEIIENKSREVGTKIFRLNKDFKFKIHKQTEQGSEFDFISSDVNYINLKLSMPGEYQVENVSVALETVLKLKQFGFSVPKEIIQNALLSAFNPGRFEQVIYKIRNTKYKILLDGAHNPEKMQAFLDSLSKIYSNKRKLFVIGFTEGKNVEEMIEKIVQFTDTFILTQFNKTTYVARQHGESVDEILKIIKQKVKGKKVFVSSTQSISEALDKVVSIVEDAENDLIVITGSLYLVGEARELIL